MKQFNTLKLRIIIIVSIIIVVTISIGFFIWNSQNSNYTTTAKASSTEVTTNTTTIEKTLTSTPATLLDTLVETSNTPIASVEPQTTTTEVIKTVVNKYYEKDLNLYMAKKVQSVLNASGVSTYMTRTTDQYISPSQRAVMANDQKASIFVSIHCNKYTSESPSGIETYYYNNYTVGNVNSSQLASYVQSSLISATSLRNRGVKTNSYTVLVDTKDMLSILTEVGFMSNPDDMSKLAQNSFKDTAAKSIANGIIKTLNEM